MKWSGEIFKILESVIEPDVSFVKPVLKKIKNKLVGKDFGNLEVEKILNKAFSKHRIIFSQGYGQPASSQKAEVGLIGGNIDSFGNIEVSYMDEFYETFEDGYLWDQFIKVTRQIISHEMVHRGQFDRIKNPDVLDKLSVDPMNAVSYFSNKLELMAMAKQSVDEFNDIGYSKEDIIKRIKRPFDDKIDPDRGESDVFWQYTELFYPSDKSLKMFLKYMFQYAKRL